MLYWIASLFRNRVFSWKLAKFSSTVYKIEESVPDMYVKMITPITMRMMQKALSRLVQA
jgi:hypothetical protein